MRSETWCVGPRGCSWDSRRPFLWEGEGAFLLSDCLLLSQTLAKHVMALHVSALTQTQAVEGEIELNKLKKLISFCRT